MHHTWRRAVTAGGRPRGPGRVQQGHVRQKQDGGDDALILVVFTGGEYGDLRDFRAGAGGWSGLGVSGQALALAIATRRYQSVAAGKPGVGQEKRTSFGGVH